MLNSNRFKLLILIEMYDFWQCSQGYSFTH
jgi:hypothetical protein